MSTPQADAQTSEGYLFPFDRQTFVAAFAADVQPLILEEWPDLSAEQLAETGGDPDKVVATIASGTEHSKTLVRKHIVEIAQIAGVGAKNIESRLIDLIRQLEKSSGLQERAEKTREAVRELGEQGKHVIEEVRQVVPRAEEKMKDNLWTVLLASLGMGVAFCVVGGVFALHAIIFLHAVAVSLLLLIPGARIQVVVGGVFALDVLIALLAFLIGASMLRRPVLRQTRATLQEVQALLAPMAADEATDRA